MAEYSADDFVMTALKGFIDVEKAKVGARLGATDALQEAGISVADKPRDPQAKSQSYTANPNGNRKLMWVVGGVVVLVVGGLVYSAIKGKG